jgi:translation initiation factor 5B
LIKADGANIGTINEIQDKGENITKVEEGMQVAISMRKPTIGRQIAENDVLYVNVREEEKGLISGLLSVEEAELLETVLEIRRRRKSTI